MTPSTLASFAISGTDTIDWYFSSSNSSNTRMRGSDAAFWVMNTGSRCAATHPARPSPGAIAITPTCDA